MCASASITAPAITCFNIVSIFPLSLYIVLYSDTQKSGHACGGRHPTAQYTDVYSDAQATRPKARAQVNFSRFFHAPQHFAVRTNVSQNG
jgi:hypothetical protein